MFLRRRLQPDPPIINEGMIFNYGKWLRRSADKRALLAYLPNHVIAEIHGEPSIRFSNEGIARNWPRVLNELGYIVDIVGWDDSKFQPTEDYALVVFHGAKNFKKIYPLLGKQARIIHFLTGSYWKFNNHEEEKRLKDFAKRHKAKAPRDRFIYEPEDEVNELADGIIVVGNQTVADTYPKYLRIEPINNANYPDDHFKKTAKDYQTVRNNFLFFAGAGNIHKGLDLLIDAFKELKDQHLYIITVPDKPVLDVFKKELELPNIHLIGEVPMRSNKIKIPVAETTGYSDAAAPITRF